MSVKFTVHMVSIASTVSWSNAQNITTFFMIYQITIYSTLGSPNIVRTSFIITTPHHMTSPTDHKVIETRNMSAETRLQTVSDNKHEREARGVPFNARTSKLLISKAV